MHLLMIYFFYIGDIHQMISRNTQVIREFSGPALFVVN